MILKVRALAIGKAISIVGGLNDSVNPQVGAQQLTTNLSALYEFVTRRLAEANANNDVSGLDEAISVLKELQAGWNDIRSEVVGMSTSPASV